MTAFTRTAAIILTAATTLAAGCRNVGQPTVLGIAPANAATITPIASLPRKTKLPQTIHGTMIEKCPVAGCWFRVQDATGVIRVDTKATGFVVTDIPLNSEVTVTGTIDVTGEKEITASGLRCP